MDRPIEAAMNRGSVAVALVLLLGAGTALGFNEPDGFRGLRWGASEQEMRSSVSVSRACQDIPVVERWRGHRSCSAVFHIGSVNVNATYAFRDDKFVRVGLRFAPKDFDRLAEIFVERYGSPTIKDSNAFVWEGAATVVSLHRHLGTSSTGYASITTQVELREAKRLRDEQTKGDAKGL